MAISVVENSTGAYVLNSDITVTEPTGTAQNDLMLCFIGYRGSVGYNTPSGWTRLWEQNIGNTDTTTSGSIASGELYYCVRGASAPSLTFTREGTVDVARARIITLRGIDTTDPIAFSDSVTMASNTATAVSNTITGSVGQFLLACVSGADQLTVSAPQINTSPATALTMHQTGSTSTGADMSSSMAGDVLTSAISHTVQFTLSGSRRHMIGVVVVREATVSGITGDLDKTMGAFTLSGSGNTAISGASSTTLGAFSVASAANATVTAAATIAPDAFTLASGGTTVIAAQASMTPDAFTVQAGAQAGIAGAGSLSLSPFSLASSGTVPVSAAASFTLGTFTLDASGELVMAGRTAHMEATLADFGFSSAGEVATLAAFGGAISPFTLDSAGAVAIAAQGLIEPDDIGASGIGQVAIGGNGDATLDPFVLTALAEVQLTGWLDTALGSIGLDASGIVFTPDAPRNRILSIPAEHRVLATGTETRVLAIAPETRSL